jgi:hypothetical protein
MGTILGTKMKEDGKVIFEVCVDYEEAVQLKGFMDNVHIFSENIAEMKTNISQRGKNEATKYFLIPRELRKNLDFNSEIKCQKIDLKTKTIFIYIADKY